MTRIVSLTGRMAKLEKAMAPQGHRLKLLGMLAVISGGLDIDALDAELPPDVNTYSDFLSKIVGPAGHA